MEAKEGNGGTWRKDGRKETGERLLRRERVKGRVGMLEKRETVERKGKVGSKGKVGTLSWKGRAKGNERVGREKARWKGVNQGKGRNVEKGGKEKGK